jgi:hypothetical protein
MNKGQWIKDTGYRTYHSRYDNVKCPTPTTLTYTIEPKFDDMTNEEEQLAMTIANYILDTEGDNYEEWKAEGNDPSKHVYFLAAKLLGEDPDADWGKP